MRTAIALIVIVLSILHQVRYVENSQLTEDEGLRVACEKMKGHFTPRNPQNEQAGEGDVCQLKFRTGTKNVQEAREFCSLYAPWRLQSAAPAPDGRSTICTVEATLMCEPGWIQMFGQCFRMPDKKKMMTRVEAEAACSSIKGKIAYLHHKYIVGVWKNYFRGVRRVWIRASEAYTKVIQLEQDPDGDLALMFNGITRDFTVPYNSLVKVSKDNLMQVLCEYQPEITIAEVNYKTRNLVAEYDEVFYPSFDAGAGRVIRTTNHYHATDGHPIDVCRAPLKAFDMEPKFTFYMIQTALNTIRNEPSSFTRSGQETPFQRSGSTCINEEKIYTLDIRYNRLVQSERLKSKCDNEQSLFVVHHANKLPTLEVAPGSIGAPFWCRVGNVIQRDYVRPSVDWLITERSNNKGYGFFLMTTKYTWDDARAACKRQWGAGVHLAGGDTLDELKAMRDFVKSKGVDNQNVWIGGRRKSQCSGIDTFTPYHDDPCSRRNVFEWRDGAGEFGFQDDWYATDRDGKLNPTSKDQMCLALIVTTNGASDPSKPGVLDDDNCDRQSYAVCGKYLPAIAT